MGSVRSWNRDSVQCTRGTRIGTMGNVHSRQESGHWEMYTQDRNRDTVQCTLRTGLGTVGNVHPGQESRQVGVYNQESGQCAVYTHIWKCTLMTGIGTVQWEVYSGGESGQYAVQNQDCNSMYTKDRKRDNVPCTRMT